MKTRSIARGIVGSVAALLGVMAAGCSADVAPGDSAEIGSTSEALTAAEIASGPALPSAVAYASSALVTVSSEQYLLVMGGQTAVTPKTYTDSVRVLRLSTSTWYTINSVLPSAVAFGQAMQKPGDASKALFFGGETVTPTYSNAVTELTLTVDGSNVPTGITTASSGTLSAARSHFKIAPCGTSTSKILIAGGSNGSPLTTLDVWSAGSVATLKDSGGTQAVTLTDSRFDFAMAEKDPTHIAVFGGRGPSANRNSIETIVVDSSCKLTSAPVSHTATKLTAVLNNARQRLEAFYDSNVATNQDKFAVVAGNDGAVSSDDDRVTIDWVTPGSSSTAAVASIGAAADRPTLYVGGNNHAYLFGGISNNNMQEANPGWTTQTTDSGGATLANRDGATADLVSLNGGASRILVVGGFDGSALLTSTLKITP